MKKYIFSIFFMILISINITSCNNYSNPKFIEDNNIKKEERKISDVNEELKDALIQNVKKYFDIELNKESFDYSMSEDSDDNKVLDESKKNDYDLKKDYIVAKAKNNNENSGISSIHMDYDVDTNMVDYMKVLKFEKIDETATLTMETAIPIAEKFIYDKNLISTNIKLKPEAITNNKGMAVMEFSYELNGEREDVKIGINSFNKEVRMFELD